LRGSLKPQPATDQLLPGSAANQDYQPLALTGSGAETVDFTARFPHHQNWVSQQYRAF
jgi:hypothetical protein